MHPLSRRSDIQIGYRIKAPRGSKLIIDHNSGGVNVSNISGDIHATVINGQITLTLRDDGQYAIDAQCKIGSVYSDFEGSGRSLHVLSEKFGRQSAPPTTNLHLRVRIGDIVILKIQGSSAGEPSDLQHVVFPRDHRVENGRQENRQQQPGQ